MAFKRGPDEARPPSIISGAVAGLGNIEARMMKPRRSLIALAHMTVGNFPGGCVDRPAVAPVKCRSYGNGAYEGEVPPKEMVASPLDAHDIHILHDGLLAYLLRTELCDCFTLLLRRETHTIYRS
ncbi:hypothetical protein ANI02nite_18560 [Acetobacter nitrogenifigens DSM 23921 = NBRC 105050]|uniref:Uncharacterized protein n=1 Tax=Acetobacter nitrogenifigens DSM 23921 = NBRC 105050 TaxID=1120919 RepID=A0A511XAN9_9PROT|nr:hypothetical protein ANI02nite_18560 [Acetobacter nitrogenifigens DSM 23921 = NBRC 105050]